MTAAVDIYDKLGVRKLINAAGTLTAVGGSLMPDDVLDTMREAGKYYVDLEELLRKSGRYVADLLGVDAALITSGAAAGLAVGVAAFMAGTDRAKIQQLPDTTGMKNEIVVHKSHRNRYDQAIRLAGAKLVEIGYGDAVHPAQLEAAIGDNTAGMVYFAHCEPLKGSLPLVQVAEICHRRNIPLFVDAAAEIPPISSFRRYLELGADLVVFSGGKELRGPQCSGLLLGKPSIIEACIQNAHPNYSIGRAMKIGKEEIAGLVRAIELYTARSEDERFAELYEAASRMAERLTGLRGASVRLVLSGEIGTQPTDIPRVYVDLDKPLLVRRDEIVRSLRTGDPAIVVDVQSKGLALSPQNLAKGEEAVVVKQVMKVVSAACQCVSSCERN